MTISLTGTGISIGGGNGGSGGTNPTYSIRTITTGPDTIVNSDGALDVNNTSAAAVALSLTTTNIGQLQTVKDVSGNAATYPITITPSSGTIDEDTNYVIFANYGAVTFYYDGANYRVQA